MASQKEIESMYDYMDRIFRKTMGIDSVLNYFKKNNMPAIIPSSLIPAMRNTNADIAFINLSGTINQLKNSG